MNSESLQISHLYLCWEFGIQINKSLTFYFATCFALGSAVILEIKILKDQKIFERLSNQKQVYKCWVHATCDKGSYNQQRSIGCWRGRSNWHVPNFRTSTWVFYTTPKTFKLFIQFFGGSKRSQLVLNYNKERVKLACQVSLIFYGLDVLLFFILFIIFSVFLLPFCIIYSSA